MHDIYASLAEAKIKESIAKGDFDQLPGKGKSLAIENMACIPPEERMAFLVMKNLGIEPMEVSLKKELEKLNDSIKTCNDEEEKAKLLNKSREMAIRCSIMMEKKRSRR